MNTARPSSRDQPSLAVVERRDIADERDAPRVDGGERPELARERLSAPAERGRERHAVDVAARRRLRRVQVAVRVEPEDARPARARTPSRPACRARSSGRRRARAARGPRRAASATRTATSLAGGHDLAEVPRVARRPGRPSRAGAPRRCRGRGRRWPRPSIRSPMPAYRIAEGPMSTPRRPPAPRSSGAPMIAMWRDCTGQR